MTPEAALARLRIYVQPTMEPTLTEQELSDLLAMFQLADADGNAPDSPAWAGAYDLRGAARQGWLMKAGKVAGDTTYTSDTYSSSLSDMHAHCMAMAASFRTAGSMAIGSINA